MIEKKYFKVEGKDIQIWKKGGMPKDPEDSLKSSLGIPEGPQKNRW